RDATVLPPGGGEWLAMSSEQPACKGNPASSAHGRIEPLDTESWHCTECGDVWPYSTPWTDDQARVWAQRQQWKFGGYYKYRFTFTAEEPGITGSASAGGDSGDIYRYSVGPVMTWKEITGAETDLRISHADGTVLFDRDDVPF